MILAARDLTVAYGPVVAVRAVSFEITEASIVAVIGANGAGKTSLLRGLMGQVSPRSGRVSYDGRDVTGARTHTLVRRGMTMVPQDRGTLSPLTVEENLALAGSRLSRSERNAQCKIIFEMFPSLYTRRSVKAGLLSGGEQQMLAFGRALITKPKMLLLDEPSIGLSPILTPKIMAAIKQLRDEQETTVLVVEQNVTAVLTIADYAYVLDRGQIVLQGEAEALRDDYEVQSAFLGI